MNFNEEEYMPRLIDDLIDDYLETFGAISVEGPKWCGKTWTSYRHAKSAVFLDDEQIQAQAKLDLELILNKEMPELIDEWTIVPQIWDKVRRKCDLDNKKGKYILTCSTKLKEKSDDENKINHSGAGRIGRVKMYTMSLWESKDSSGNASIMDMYEGTQKNVSLADVDIKNIARLIIRGGWPGNLNAKNVSLIPKSYIESILEKDMNDDKKRDKNKMIMLLKSLARNETSVVSNQTIINDIEEYNTDSELIESRITLTDYLDVLTRLHLIENQNAYSENYRSKERLGKSAKRHFTDPSLACAALNLTEEMLINDLKTFGFMFEALVERDLRIYMEYLGGQILHFRDNVTGLKVDSILEFADGSYAAAEIKLGFHQVEEAKASLLKFCEYMLVKPKFMCVIVGNANAVMKDPETGIYILPITALKP